MRYEGEYTSQISFPLGGIGSGSIGLGSMCGFPHFRKVVFEGEFPIARLFFEDEDFPGKITMTAFNPFIPLDADNSSIPGAFFELEVENTSREHIEYQLAFSVMNPFPVSENCR